MALPHALEGLFPSPKKIRLGKGSCPFGRDRGFRADFPKERRLRETFARWEKSRAAALGMETLKNGPRLDIELGVREIPREGFRIDISPKGVVISAREAAGAFYALQTLMRIVRDNGEGALPCAVIEDWPDMPMRGFMLDVSRCKVPTLESLLELVPQLAALRLNTLQLYVEHTFAFKGGETAWADASPLTPDDLQALEAACQRHFIELVPNLNGFGHMDRWLRHPEWKSLAECPEGYERPLGAGWSPFGGTLKPDEASLAFVDKLYADYLPRFASQNFNAGCDEPWELGRDASAARCEREGKHKVYIDHVLALHKLAGEKYGKRMQFWADILMESPEQAARLPRDVMPVLWGYEANHPIGEQALAVAKSGLEFIVAPGSSAWLTFSGRWDNARLNIERCAEAALESGASGLLLTSWGDNGNLQPWPVFYAPLALASALAWNVREIPDDATIARAIDFVFFNGAGGIGESLIALGLCEKGFLKIHNRSRLYQAALADEAVLQALVGELPESLCAETDAVLAAQENVLKRLAQSTDKNGVALAAEELLWGVQMNRFALARLAQCRSGKPDPKLYPALRRLLGKLENLWLRRARVGGLYEAQGPLRGLLEKMGG